MLALLVLLLTAPGAPEHAEAEAMTCGTPTSWHEEVDPGYWRGVCGDERGEAVRIVGHEAP